jgi:hypothetical protein
MRIRLSFTEQRIRRARIRKGKRYIITHAYKDAQMHREGIALVHRCTDEERKENKGLRGKE